MSLTFSQKKTLRIVMVCALALPVALGTNTVAQAQAVPTAVQADNPTAVTLTPQDRVDIDANLTAQGLAPLPQEAVALDVTEEKIIILDAAGNRIDYDHVALPTLQPMNTVTDEIKRVVGACLGIDFFAATTAWEAIESQVNSWDKAAKFVLRRVGAIALLSCGGGIFAEYVL